MSKFKLLMLSAMYENGGNTTHRLLDGHPELFVYPFESQVGTKYVNDNMSSMYPAKYRWPEFLTSMNSYSAYKAIIDEEGKVRARTPFVSKFRDAEIDMNDDERCKIFEKLIGTKKITRALAIEAFYKATFKAWKNYYTKKASVYVGYSPVVGIDAEKIVEDGMYVLNVIRNPFSAYADTKKRPVPMSLSAYMTGWAMHQYKALMHQKMFPNNVFVLRYEDIIANPKKALGSVLKKLGVGVSETLTYPSWNGQKLENVYPWGTIKVPTPIMNIKTAKELSKKEIEAIYIRTEEYIEKLNYGEIFKEISKK